MNTYILIHRYGNREEVPFLVRGGREYVSPHVSREEIDTEPAPKPMIFDPLIYLFETVREKVGRPIVISSGYRSPEYQRKLYEDDIRKNGGRPSGRVAKPGSSPHETGAAMDMYIPAGWTAQKLAEIFQETSVALGFPKCRVGWRQYLGRGFIHVDLVHMLFAPYTNTPNPNPQAWRPGVTW